MALTDLFKKFINASDDDDYEDDLFDDELEDKNKTQDKESVKVGAVDNKQESVSNISKLDLNSIDDDAPILPFNDEEKKDDEYDLQKELEAKFDELFGPIDED